MIARIREKADARAVNGAVLDIETAPAADLVVAAGRRSAAGFARPCLHKVVCATVLTYRQCLRSGAFSGVELHTFTTERDPEASVLVGIDLMLPDPTDPDARVVTWNGVQHDMRMLRTRATALWMTGLRALRGWTSQGCRDRHLDLMRSGGGGAGNWSRLRDVCASMGVSLHPGDETMTRALAAGAWDRVAAHNRMDVLGTFLVYAARDGFDRGCPVPSATAWSEVARITSATPRNYRQESALSSHYLIGVAERQLARHDGHSCGCGGARMEA